MMMMAGLTSPPQISDCVMAAQMNGREPNESLTYNKQELNSESGSLSAL